MTKQIDFTDANPIGRSDLNIVKNKISQIIKKKDFILGEQVSFFEKKFSKLSKTKFSVGCASGTDALILALKSLNLRKNDEVIVPAFTYISTGLSVLLNNNKLVYADVEIDTGLISLSSILKKVNKKTKAIIPVNLYGQKVDLKMLRKKVGNNIFIIEDSAQSHFAYSCFYCKKNNNTYCCKNEKNDNYADISCYSFYPAKNLGAFGDGGMISTNNKNIYKKLLFLRNLGSIKKHKHDLVGMNSRLDTIQAAILSIKLKTILSLNDRRRKIAKEYDNKLRDIKQIKITKTNPGSSRHLYVIRTKQRKYLMEFLIKNKVMCQIHYPYSLNKLKAFVNLPIKKGNLKNSISWSKECLSLPIHPNMKLVQINQIAKLIKRYFLKKK